MKRFLGQLCIILAAFFWGLTFSAQKIASATIRPSGFLALRSIVGALALLLIVAIRDAATGRKITFFATPDPTARHTLLRGSFWCGVAMLLAALAQQYGVEYSTASKSGFLTTLYIVFIPLSGVFVGRFPCLRLVLCAIGAVVGMYLLCCGLSKPNFETGDLCLIACAIFWTMHVLVVGRYAPRTDCIRLSCIQFAITAIFALIIALLTENTLNWTSIRPALGAILFAGIFSSGVAFTLQIIGQKTVPPTQSSLLMSLESVFSAIGGYLVLNEHQTAVQWLGCAIIFIAVIISQIPSRQSAQ